MSARRASALLTLIMCAASSGTGAQAVFRAEGHVRSTHGSPVEGATVATDRARTLTDSLGRFQLPLERTDSTTISVRRLGFEEVTFTMPTDSLALHGLAIELEPVARELDEVRVKEQRVARVPTLERFADRRREKDGLGFFLTREDILRRDGAPLSSLLGEARGVTLLRNGNRTVLRFTRWTQRGRPCAPHVWLDGVQTRGLEVDDIPSRDVEAVELYASGASAPTELQTGNQFSCGVVAIWTRRPILNKP